MSEVFISYAPQDKFFARRIRTLLVQQGYEVWFDVDGPGDCDAPAQARDQIALSRIVVALISQSGALSARVRSEAEFAASRALCVIAVSIAGGLDHEATLEWDVALDRAIRVDPEAPDFLDVLVSQLRARLLEARASATPRPGPGVLHAVEPTEEAVSGAADLRRHLDEVLDRYGAMEGSLELFDRMLARALAQSGASVRTPQASTKRSARPGCQTRKRRMAQKASAPAPAPRGLSMAREAGDSVSDAASKEIGRSQSIWRGSVLDPCRFLFAAAPLACSDKRRSWWELDAGPAGQMKPLRGGPGASERTSAQALRSADAGAPVFYRRLAHSSGVHSAPAQIQPCNRHAGLSLACLRWGAGWQFSHVSLALARRLSADDGDQALPSLSAAGRDGVLQRPCSALQLPAVCAPGPCMHSAGAQGR